MTAVRHRLERTECSPSIACDSLSAAREAWRQDRQETDYYMAWTHSPEPPTGVSLRVQNLPPNRHETRNVRSYNSQKLRLVDRVNVMEYYR
jgi:hypothetical protein